MMPSCGVFTEQNYRFNIATQTLKVSSPEFEHLNQVKSSSLATSQQFLIVYLKIISRVMCGVTTSMRFPGQLNGSVDFCFSS
jgi:hypothetical protein